MTGLFIVVEALDGVGKTTLVGDLARVLGGITMDTPGPALRGLAPGVLEALGRQQAARALFYAASVVSIGAQARALVQAGATVVMARYWLSTISYARARGVDLDLRGVEAGVPTPDVTVLLTLDEDERQRRLRARVCTEADRETLDTTFRARVLAEMRSPMRSAGLGPTVEVDVTGADREEAVRRVMLATGSNGPTGGI